MKKIETVLLAGAGAVGLTQASIIYQWNPKAIQILATGERFIRYKENGLKVNQEIIPFSLVNEVNKLGSPENPIYPDLIIIACKYHHLEQVIIDIKNYVGPDTLILSLLNGISSEEIIGESYGAKRLPLAMIMGTDAQHKNESTTFKQKGTIYFGEKKNPTINGKANTRCSEKVQTIAAFFDEVGISYNIPENMLKKQWFKFMSNVGINQASAILKLPYGPFQNNKKPGNISYARQLMTDAMKEVVLIAQKEGIDLTEDDFQEWYDCLDSLTPESSTSMCQDIMAGRKTEVEMFALTVIELGKKHGIPTPVNQVFYYQIKTLEEIFNR
jgi:2-dehydropantoate 2-reductase